MAHQIPPDGTLLPLMEEFYTIQGEGFHSGKAAYFIRLGGCDVGCHWCDVKESWDAELHPLTTANQIVQNAEKFPGTWSACSSAHRKSLLLNTITFSSPANGKISGLGDLNFLGDKQIQSQLPESG